MKPTSIIKSVSDLVTDHHSDGAKVPVVGIIAAQKRRLKNTGRERWKVQKNHIQSSSIFLDYKNKSQTKSANHTWQFE